MLFIFKFKFKFKYIGQIQQGSLVLIGTLTWSLHIVYISKRLHNMAKGQNDRAVAWTPPRTWRRRYIRQRIPNIDDAVTKTWFTQIAVVPLAGNTLTSMTSGDVVLRSKIAYYTWEKLNLQIYRNDTSPSFARGVSGQTENRFKIFEVASMDLQFIYTNYIFFGVSVFLRFFQ